MLCIGFIIMHCVSTAQPPVSAGALFCQVAKPIYWNAADTRVTKEAADRHNRIGKELCGWGRKK